MKYQHHLLIVTCVGAFALCGSPWSFAAPKPAASPAAVAAASPSEAAPAKAPRAIPLRGNATEVNKAAKTFTVAGKTASRTYKATDKTTITKAGASATFADLTENEAVTGSYWKQADGTLELKSLKIGGKTEAEKAADAAKKEKREAKKAAAAEAAAEPSASPKK